MTKNKKAGNSFRRILVRLLVADMILAPSATKEGKEKTFYLYAEP